VFHWIQKVGDDRHHEPRKESGMKCSHSMCNRAGKRLRKMPIDAAALKQPT
jgi:hypothetical protein